MVAGIGDGYNRTQNQTKPDQTKPDQTGLS